MSIKHKKHQLKNLNAYYLLYSAWGYKLFSIKKNILLRFFGGAV